MNLPLRQPRKHRLPKVRTKPRRQKAVRCRPHVNWVLAEFHCSLAEKVSKITGQKHVCEGRLDPHHTPTRGAGGGDDNIVPLCRCAHSLLDSWDRSEASVEAEYGVAFREIAASLWAASPHRRVYERTHTPGATP